LTFDKAHGGGITLQFYLTNFGHSPAEYVDIEGEFIPLPLSKERCDVATEQKRFRDEIRLRTLKLKLSTVLPNANSIVPVPFVVGFTMSPTDIAAGLAYLKTPWIEPYIIGCVDYRFPFSDEHHHQTGFAYIVVPKVRSHLIEPCGVIAADSLEIGSVGASQAD